MSTQPFRGMEILEMRFGFINERGLVSVILIAILFSFVVAYFAGIYMTFSLGMVIQKQGKEEKQLSKEVQEKELTLQKELTSLAEIKPDILESMVRVSGIKYLSTPNFVAADAIRHP